MRAAVIATALTERVFENIPLLLIAQITVPHRTRRTARFTSVDADDTSGSEAREI
jgi:hypothetical protein